MVTTTKKQRHRAVKNQNRARQLNFKSAREKMQGEAYDLVLSRRDVVNNGEGSIPEQVLLLVPRPNAPETHHLFIDQIPVPRDAWSYDSHDKILRWKGLHGGGQLHIYHSGRGATGMIGEVGNEVNVTAGARAQFLCNVALDVGAAYVTQGGQVTGLSWDNTSAKWKNATWTPNRLLLTYTVKQGSPIAPPTFTFEFEDKVTQSIPWQPGVGSFAASLKLGEYNNRMVWDLVFKSNVPPPMDIPKPTDGPDTVYPYWLMSREDSAAANINGVIEIDKLAPNGTLVGIEGSRTTTAYAGYFQTAAHKAPFALFNGQMQVDGKAIANSHIKGRRLNWENLDSHHQELLGLPACGSLIFNRYGSFARNKDMNINIQRLSASNTSHQIARHQSVHPNTHSHLQLQANILADDQLTITGLLDMTSFNKNSKGEWGDVVQEAVRADLGEIMNSFISPDIWKLLFPTVKQPTLTGYLAQVANTPVSGVKDPKTWYQSLGTAVLTQGMANGSDKNTDNMNGPRAAAWLKDEVTNSKVYQAHGQLLFKHHWQLQNPETSNYLADQITNASKYQSTIDSKTQSVIADINKNVIEGDSSPKDLKKKLITEVQAVSAYAKTNNLFWAFAFYTYNTAPSILANIALQMGSSTGSSDGTTLSRMFQQNITTLTALDPSGYFAQQYNQTINIFLGSNILPSMFGFKGDGSAFTLIKEYLEEFVKQNINNEDQQIAQAANQIAQILADRDSDAMIKKSIEALHTFAETIDEAMAFPYIANRWLGWFKTNYPKFSTVGSVFGSVLIGGLSAMAMFNLVLEYKNWDKLTTEQKTELIINSIQLGLQLLSAVVKRGVRLYAIFQVDGMSFAQRTAAVSRIIATGEADALDDGLATIGNRTAQWLGDTEGATALRNVTPLFEEEAEMTLTAKIFGANLEEFIATRIGPIFILAGIGLSIYFMITGDTGVALANDIINIVSGALTLFAMVGGWLIEGGIIAAEGVMATIIAVAGPLAIIAALVGIGLMIYEMFFNKPPDPVKEFVDQYVKPAGFYVASKRGSIDYARAYALKDQDNLMMLGFSLGNANKLISVAADGSTSLINSPTYLPDSVWKVSTNGVGLSQIGTAIVEKKGNTRKGLFLSLMSDNSISFQPLMSNTKKSGSAPTVVTQTWLSTPEGNVELANDNTALASLSIVFQAVLPDKDGKYARSQAAGWLTQTSTGLGYDTSGTGTIFTFSMSGIAPNDMGMNDLSFILNSKPSTAQLFGPFFGTLPSTPLSYELASNNLPDFLDFDSKTGKFKPNGKAADKAISIQNTITAIGTALNSLKASANFTVTVAAAKVPT